MRLFHIKSLLTASALRLGKILVRINHEAKHSLWTHNILHIWNKVTLRPLFHEGQSIRSVPIQPRMNIIGYILLEIQMFTIFLIIYPIVILFGFVISFNRWQAHNQIHFDTLWKDLFKYSKPCFVFNFAAKC